MITTSRYASRETRALAKGIASDSGERYVARGKKTVDALTASARRLGEASIRVVEEQGGRAAVLSTISVDETGRWSWGEERLLNSTEKCNKVTP